MKETFLIYFMLAKIEFSSEVTAIELTMVQVQICIGR